MRMKLPLLLITASSLIFSQRFKLAEPATTEPAVAIITATSCPAGKIPVRWTSKVSLAAADWPNVQRGLDSPVDIHTDDAMEMVNGKGETKSPRTGSDYLKFVAAGFGAKTNLDNRKGSWFKDACLPLKWLERAKPSEKTYLKDWDPSKDPAGALAVLPSSLGFILAGDPTHAIWKDEWPNSVAKAHGPWAIDVDDHDGGETVLEVVAWGDFDGDGIEDVLLSVSHYATGGSFCSYEYVTVTRTSAHGPIKVIPE